MNWERYFRNTRQTKLADDDLFDFGTVGGTRTIAELRDLVAAHTYSIEQTRKAINNGTPTLALRPQEYVLLLNDWNVLLARWNAARAAAQTALNSWHALPENLAPAESEYVGILKALQLSYPELRTSPGDLVDIVGRLTKLNVPTNYSQMPQPRAGTDADLEVLKATDSVIKAATPSNKTWVKTGIVAVAALVVLKKLALL